MTAAMQQTVTGDPFAAATEMGPMVSKRQRELVHEAVQQALKDGAKLECGGSFASGKGYYYQPTVLTGCRQETGIMQQEIFGPVLPIATFETLDEAIGYANDCEYGLTSSIYTRNLDVAMRACNELKFGETYVNRENFEAMQGFHAGWRKSGIGGADGKHGLEEYLADPRCLHELRPEEAVGTSPMSQNRDMRHTVVSSLSALYSRCLSPRHRRGYS